MNICRNRFYMFIIASPVEVVAAALVVARDAEQLAPCDRQPGPRGEPPDRARQLAVIVAGGERRWWLVRQPIREFIWHTH